MVTFNHELYPFTGSYRIVNGQKLHVLDEGRGDAVLMLHGNPTWSYYFRNLVLGLRDRYRVIVPDHVGCGLSDRPDGRGAPRGRHPPVAPLRKRRFVRARP